MISANLLLVFCLRILAVAANAFKAELTQRTLESPDNIIQITNSDLTSLSQPNRDHYTLILLTSTDEKHNCGSCLTLKNALARVSQSYFSDYSHADYLFIAEVDIADTSNLDVFKYLRLDTVPQLWLVPPSNIASKHASSREKKFDEFGDEVFDNYDILLEPHMEFKLPAGSLDDQTYKLADWLAQTIQKRILLRQDNASKKFITTFAVTFGSILLVKKKGPAFITGTVTKSKIYKVLFFVYLLLVLSGLSFSMIKGVPLVGRGEKAVPIYISGGIHWQFGMETFIVAATYGALGSVLVSLAYLGSYKVTETSKIRSEKTYAAVVLGLTAALFLLYSAMTSIFLRKDSEYPYYVAKLF